MDLSQLTGNERIIAEQAVLAYQAVHQAALNAADGQGINAIEQVIHDQGFQILRRMIELGASEHPEAQKKGSAANRAPAATP